MNYYDSLEKRWIKYLHRYLPVSIQLFLVRCIAYCIFFLNINNLRSQTEYAVKAVFPEKSQIVINKLIKNNIYEIVRQFFDLALLMHKPNSYIISKLKPRIKINGIEYLQEAINSDRGIFLVSAHFACFYYMLLAEIDAIDEINILKAFDSDGRDELYAKLSNVSTKKLEGINLKNQSSGIRAYKKLKSKKLVACMFDNFFDETTLVSASFLGRPALASAGVATLAIKSNAILLTAFIVRNGSDYTLEFDKMLDPVTCQATTLNNKIVFLSEELNKAIEKRIKQYPHQWQAWTTLDKRWNLVDI